MNDKLFAYLVDTASPHDGFLDVVVVPGSQYLSYDQFCWLQKLDYKVILATSPRVAEKLRGVLISRLFIYCEHMCEVNTLIVARHRLARVKAGVLYTAFKEDVKWKETKDF
jgi:hypothetical protein